MHKQEHQVSVLGGTFSPAPMTTTVINMPSETSVRDHVIWSMFNALFLNFCCLGFIAYAYSVKSRDRKMVGDMTGAQAFASTAKGLNICATVFGIITTIIIIIIVAIFSAAATQAISQTMKNHGGF